MIHAVTHKDDDEDERSARDPDAPKERVLHTRVPAVLEQELKRLARGLRVPVSNVVRAILEDAIDAVDTVGERAEDRIHNFAQRMSKQRSDLRTKVSSNCPSPPQEALEGALGFQSLVLASDTHCTICNRALEAGEEACRAIFDEPGKKVLLGSHCRLMPAPKGETND